MPPTPSVKEALNVHNAGRLIYTYVFPHVTIARNNQTQQQQHYQQQQQHQQQQQQQQR